jgi:hypothetical protein
MDGGATVRQTAAQRATIKTMAPDHSRWGYYMMASLIAGAALIKAGAPILPILFAIAAVGVWNLRRKP